MEKHILLQPAFSLPAFSFLCSSPQFFSFATALAINATANANGPITSATLPQPVATKIIISIVSAEQTAPAIIYIIFCFGILFQLLSSCIFLASDLWFFLTPWLLLLISSLLLLKFLPLGTSLPLHKLSHCANPPKAECLRRLAGLASSL